jgi:hypothetical protein
MKELFSIIDADNGFGIFPASGLGMTWITVIIQPGEAFIDGNWNWVVLGLGPTIS